MPQRLRREDGASRGLLHEMDDQSALFAPLAKAVLSAATPDEAVAAVTRAAELAMAAPRGPVYVGIPSDLLGQPADAGRPVRAPLRLEPAAADIDAAARLIAQSESPLLWVGGGAVASGAAEQVDAMAWRLGAPVVTTYAARGLLGDGHILLADAPPHEPAVADLIAQADLMLAVGTQFDGMTTRNWAMPVPPRLVLIDVAPERAAANYPPDAVIRADAALALDALAVHCAPREPWPDSVFRLREVVRRQTAADPVTAAAAAILDAVEGAWPAEAAVVCDMAVAGYWVGGYAAMPRPRRLQYPVGWGTLGYALPASIGPAAAGIRTLAVVGDGGLAMAVGELATLAQERLPVTVLLVDDGGYGMLRYDQQRFGHAERGVDLAGPDWLALAEAYGIPAAAAGSPGRLHAALAAAASADGPNLVLLRGALEPPRTTSPRWGDPV